MPEEPENSDLKMQPMLGTLRSLRTLYEDLTYRKQVSLGEVTYSA